MLFPMKFNCNPICQTSRYIQKENDPYCPRKHKRQQQKGNFKLSPKCILFPGFVLRYRKFRNVDTALFVTKLLRDA